MTLTRNPARFLAILAVGGTTVLAAPSHAAPEEGKTSGKSNNATDSDANLALARQRVQDGEAFTVVLKQPKKGSATEPSVTVLVGDQCQGAPATAPLPRGSDELTETGPGGPSSSLIDMALGPGVMTRSFDYSPSPANTPNLRSYKLPSMAVVEAEIELFPAVGVALPVVGDLGVGGRYGHSIDMPSLTADGRTFLTHSHRWHVSLLYRNRMGSDERLRIRGAVSYGQQQFKLSPQDTRAAQIALQTPSVDYPSIKVQAQAGYAFAPMTIWFGAGYVKPLGGGQIYDNFRDPTLHGIDLDARVDITLGGGFGLRIASDYRRIFSSFNSSPGDPYVAGGALEQLTTAKAAIRYVH